MQPASTIFIFLDLLGTFVFALSGAVAARQKQLDVFGIFSVAFTVACGGGIIRDVCIGAIPPAGLTNWLYLMVVLIASILAFSFYRLVNQMKEPVILFDALGLAVFAVTGARKAINFGHNYEVAILLGVVTAVGGGVLRDILLNRIPVILKKEIYASAALAGAMIVVIGHKLHFSDGAVSVVAFLVALFLPLLALHYHWNLPAFNLRGADKEIEE